eukprot:CAMPEP_0119555440 /NCGR_PEP_ID=MMETSP1352-20130426/7653_1 /TAXON_ID=265584 /ORGANISM="Stauroneis constricta, Strain CCMP1120" /LENGTH=166 /DNA_ID=CAMNT_0007602201 /DNA_START=70 /DNA_END=570 /DNA_ORIENTATION=+
MKLSVMIHLQLLAQAVFLAVTTVEAGMVRGATRKREQALTEDTIRDIDEDAVMLEQGERKVQQIPLASLEGFGGAAGQVLSKGDFNDDVELIDRNSFNGGEIFVPICPNPGYAFRIPSVEALNLKPCELSSECEIDDCCLFPDCHCAPRNQLHEFTADPFGQCTSE